MIKGANNITEFVFDLESEVIPSQISLSVSNNQGRYAPDVALFRQFSVNQLLIKVTDDLSNLLFLGVLTKVQYTLSEARFKVSNVIYEILSLNIDSFSFSGTPSEFALEIFKVP